MRYNIISLLNMFEKTITLPRRTDEGGFFFFKTFREVLPQIILMCSCQRSLSNVTLSEFEENRLILKLRLLERVYIMCVEVRSRRFLHVVRHLEFRSYSNGFWGPGSVFIAWSKDLHLTVIVTVIWTANFAYGKSLKSVAKYCFSIIDCELICWIFIYRQHLNT